MINYCCHDIERQDCEQCSRSIKITTISGGGLIAGDIVTFKGVRWWPWYKRLWYHLRYMRHNNPMFKPEIFRRFVVM